MAGSLDRLDGQIMVYLAVPAPDVLAKAQPIVNSRRQHLLGDRSNNLSLELWTMRRHMVAESFSGDER